MTNFSEDIILTMIKQILQNCLTTYTFKCTCTTVLGCLLELAPGMSNGMSFGEVGAVETSKPTCAVAAEVDLSEMLFGENAAMKWSDPVSISSDAKVFIPYYIDTISAGIFCRQTLWPFTDTTSN